MSFLDLNPQAEADQLDYASRNLLEPGEAQFPPWFPYADGGEPSSPAHSYAWPLVRSVGTGLAAGGANAALALSEAATPALRPIAQSLDDYFGTDVDGWLAQQQQITREAATRTTPSPWAVGKAGVFVHDLVRFGGEAALGASVGGLPGAVLVAGASEGVPAYRAFLHEGLDPQTAAELGGIEGVASGVSAVLPMTGATALRSVARGAISILSLNALQRGVTSTVLDNAGYPAMARQYQAFDSEAILSDALMGAFFGVGAHVAMHAPEALAGAQRAGSAVSDAAQSAWDTMRGNVNRMVNPDLYSQAVDAAQTTADAAHMETAGPGAPITTASRNANVGALQTAIDDLLHDRPVEVSDQVAGAAFVRGPGEANFRDQVAQAVNDSDAGRAAAELARQDQEPAPSPEAEAPSFLPYATDTSRRSRSAIDPERDSLSTAVAKLGGIDADQAASEWGSQITDDAGTLRRAAWEGLGLPGGGVIRKGGKAIDAMVEALGERGYLPVDEHGKADFNDLYEGLVQEAGGSRQFTAQGQEALMRRMANERWLAESTIPVADETGAEVPAHQAFAALQAERGDVDVQRQMLEAAAGCEGALL